MSNGDILDKIDNKIERALADKRLGKTSRMTLEVQSLFVAFLRQSEADHPRVTKLWDERSINVWAIRLGAGSLLGILVTQIFG